MSAIHESMLIGLSARAPLISLALTLVLLDSVTRSAGAASAISGASQAVCTPAPCAPAQEIAAYTLAGVSNGDGTTATREYGVYRPTNLVPSPSNRAPAVLVFYQAGNCGLKPSGRFASFAPAQRFVVIYMEVPCGRDNNWDKRNVDPTTSTAVNDEPYVTAVVEAITQCPSSGAGANQCIDPQRIYAAGASSGGNMTADVMCDVQNSPLFRGYLIDSSSLQLFEGAPACPSANSHFFVMMALSNYSIDEKLYYDTDVNPHLDVPAFADWAATRLGCTGQRVDDAIGYPLASTLRYTYSGPCVFALAGSPAVVTLGVQNGAHTWVCQDSGAGAQPNECTTMPNPPGLTAAGLPNTNGLFVEQEFWSFLAEGLSPAEPPSLLEPQLPATSPVLGSAVSSGATTAVTTTAPPASSYVALGDGYAAGDGNTPYLQGSDSAHDRCHRSRTSYPFIVNDQLSASPSGLAFHACSGARIADFYAPNLREQEPPQLQWIGHSTRLVSLSIGWADALMPALLRSCVRDSANCQAQWQAHVSAALQALAGRSLGNGRSLYRLFREIVSLAPEAKVTVLGYPRLFPAEPPAHCSTGAGRLSFTRGAMRWINANISRLDDLIGKAAAAAHATYVSASPGAFAGHERCTPEPAVSGALPLAASHGRAQARTFDANASFSPNERGELRLASLLERTVSARPASQGGGA